jgi:hypothetical protein
MEQSSHLLGSLKARPFSNRGFRLQSLTSGSSPQIQKAGPAISFEPTTRANGHDSHISGSFIALLAEPHCITDSSPSYTSNSANTYARFLLMHELADVSLNKLFSALIG